MIRQLAPLPRPPRDPLVLGWSGGRRDGIGGGRLLPDGVAAGARGGVGPVTAIATKAQILALANEGVDHREIATRLGCSVQRVLNITETADGAYDPERKLRVLAYAEDDRHLDRPAVGKNMGNDTRRPKPLAPCGTTAAWRRHRRRGEAPCDACRAANSARTKARRSDVPKPAPKARSVAPHGTQAAYVRHWRRGETPCGPCATAHLAHERKRSAERVAVRAEVRASWLAQVTADVVRLTTEGMSIERIAAELHIGKTRVSQIRRDAA